MSNIAEDLKSGKITLGFLADELFIKMREYEDRIVLNYDQIQSPKNDPYVIQCRGLVLSKDFEVLCLPFDRFFNLGETIDHCAYIDWSKAKCYEKVDGSLIKIYHDGNKWYCATRGTAFGESDVFGWPCTFAELVYRALDVSDDAEFNSICNEHLDPDVTYLFEVTARENRVVTNYIGYTLWYLASRNKLTGEYIDSSNLCEKFGAKLPNAYGFGGVEECVHTASNLPDLQEGYVLYQDDKPFCKIKSPAYVAVHHIRGEGLNPKRICQLVLTNEQDEYLKYFPEDEEYITPYVDKLNVMLEDIRMVAFNVRNIEDQKSFALVVKNFPYSAVLFKWKKTKGDVIDVFHSQPDNYKLKLFNTIMGVDVEELEKEYA